MSVKTSVSSTAQSLSTRPGMLSGPGALRALILLRDLLTLSGDSIITWSPGGGGVFCAVVLFCASKRAKKAFIRGGWCCHRSVVGACSRGLHGSKNSNPKRPVNMLHGTDPDPYFI